MVPGKRKVSPNPSAQPGSDHTGSVPQARGQQSTWSRLADGGRPLLALLTLAALVKLLVIAVSLNENPLGSNITSDARYYVDRAQGMAGVIDDPLGDEVYHLPPLYPALLSIVPGVVDESFGLIMALQACAGLVLLASVFVFARRRGTVLAALIATGLTLAYGPLTFFETKLLGDQLATVLLMASLVAADALHDRPSPWRSAAVGLLLGLSCLARPQVLLLLPVFGLWASRLKPRVWPALALAAALPFVPVIWHNAAASGQFVMISDNGGVNLWLANAGPPSGTFLSFDRDFGNIETQAAVATQRAEAALGKPLSPSEVSQWYAGQTWAVVTADPALFAQRLWLRARALIENFETGVVVVPQVEMTFLPPLRLLALPFGALLAVAAAAAVLLIGAGRPHDETQPRSTAPLLPSVAVAGMVVITTLMFYHYSRFRLPLVPLLAVTVGIAVDRVQAKRPSVIGAAAAILIAAAAGWASWQPNSHHAGVQANGWTIVADARRSQAGPRDIAAQEQALRDVQTALSFDGGFVRAQMLGAELALGLNQFDLADRYLDGAEPSLSDDPGVLSTRAVLSLRKHPNNRHLDGARAANIIEQLRIMALEDPALYDLVAILERLAQRAS
ncbi:MAG: hypothetical protein ACI9EF_002724 [Pseudohongiellaceae bacterium]|jgi:hypothetical protein